MCRFLNLVDLRLKIGMLTQIFEKVYTFEVLYILDNMLYWLSNTGNQNCNEGMMLKRPLRLGSQKLSKSIRCLCHAFQWTRGRIQLISFILVTRMYMGQ